ncbi:MAG: tetratricopeptide repeat protein, partial [Thermoanaerobaculia bacterium]
ARPAAAGSTEAMRVLGWAYRLGEGVEKDQAKAADWWRRGAEGGNSYCMMWYSQMLFSGEGGKKDATAALAWLERSGERGNAWAIRDLGHFYDEGARGLPRDEKKAAYWWRKALAFNDDEARGWLIAHHLLE